MMRHAIVSRRTAGATPAPWTSAPQVWASSAPSMTDELTGWGSCSMATPTSLAIEAADADRLRELAHVVQNKRPLVLQFGNAPVEPSASMACTPPALSNVDHDADLATTGGSPRSALGFTSGAEAR